MGYFDVMEMAQRFGGILALKDMSFSVERGEVFGIIGPNGAGKTTLLNCICGVYRMDGGRVVLDGTELTGSKPHKIVEVGITRTFQHADFFAEMSVEDFLLLSRLKTQVTSLANCALGLPRARCSERDEHRRAREMLARFGLVDIALERLANLPYGTRKVVDICRALMPEVLLMDEPTSGTSAADRELLRGMVHQLRSDGLTIVVVDHDVGFISDVCDRILAMNLGRPLATGAPHDVLTRPEVIESYVGLEE
jgi:branched-chain amino acid transport system ATP-binding protein